MSELDSTIFVTDDDGNEKEMEIYFTFESKEYGKNYVLFYDPNNEEDIFAASYDEEDNLYMVEDQQEWDMVNEVLEAFNNEESEEDQESQA